MQPFNPQPVATPFSWWAAKPNAGNDKDTGAVP